MPKVKIHAIKPKEKYQIIGDFFEIISELKSKKEVIDFFVGLLTPSEAIMMARRIQIGKLILQGKSYEEIRKKLKVGFHTITKTEEWIHGNEEKYSQWIEKCLTKNIDVKNSKSIQSYGSLLDKYPGHRLLKNLLSD